MTKTGTDQIFAFRGKQYSVKELIERFGRRKSTRIPIVNLMQSMEYRSWFVDHDIVTLADVNHHLKRIMSAELEYPIFVADKTIVVDGWHRVFKANIRKHKTIKAIHVTTDEVRSLSEIK